MWNPLFMPLQQQQQQQQRLRMNPVAPFPKAGFLKFEPKLRVAGEMSDFVFFGFRTHVELV